jgi:Ca2+/Na+ antiporter
LPYTLLALAGSDVVFSRSFLSFLLLLFLHMNKLLTTQYPVVVSLVVLCVVYCSFLFSFPRPLPGHIPFILSKGIREVVLE